MSLARPRPAAEGPAAQTSVGVRALVRRFDLDPVDEYGRLSGNLFLLKNAEGQIAGILDLEGLLRTDGWKGADFVKPDNKPAERAYYWIDIPVMAESAGLTNAVREVYLEAGPAKNPGGFPIGGQTRIHLRNDHLQYAITWYALAIILAVIYGVFSYRPVEEKP